MLTLLRTYLAAASTARQSRDEVLAIRERRFRRLLTYAWDHSEFYRELYRAAGIARRHLDRLPIAELPIVGKSDIRQNFDRVLTTREINRAEIDAFFSASSDPRHLFKGRYRVLHTSGTTAEPAIFCYAPDDWERGLALQGRVFNGLRVRRKVAVYCVARAHTAGASLAAGTQAGILRGLYDTRLFDIAEPFDSILEALNAFQPHALFAYASALEQLAEAQRSGSLQIAPALVSSGAEPTPHAARELICSAFPGARCIDFYAATEVPAMGVGELESGRLRLMDDFYYFELDEQGILLTNLFNFTQPLIRYRLGDLVRPVASEERDRPFQVVEAISTRARAEIRIRGRSLSPGLFGAMHVPGVRRFQYAIAADALQVRVIPDGSASLESICAAVNAHWRTLFQRLGLQDVGVVVQPMPALPVDPTSGKLPLVATAADAA